MKLASLSLLISASLTGGMAQHAWADRTSANYSIATDTADAGGRRATSAAYTNDGSVGGIAGLSTVAAPAESAKHGYIGQLFEVVGFVVHASPTSVSEGGTRQLAPSHLLDDATLLAITPTLVNWSVISGPIGSISPGGLATAGIVPRDTPASVRGSFGGFIGSLNLTVLDSIPDNFGSYAGDKIGDDWQVQYFGLNNPNAAPSRDPDGDGQNNRFEFLAGLIPTDPASVFKLRIERTGEKTLVIFSPIISGRTYTVTYNHDLSLPPPWPPLPPGFTTTQNGDERTVTELQTQALRQRFYRVEIGTSP